jgi:hypothetical protein
MYFVVLWDVDVMLFSIYILNILERQTASICRVEGSL